MFHLHDKMCTIAIWFNKKHIIKSLKYAYIYLKCDYNSVSYENIMNWRGTFLVKKIDNYSKYVHNKIFHQGVEKKWLN